MKPVIVPDEMTGGSESASPCCVQWRMCTDSNGKMFALQIGSGAESPQVSI